VKGFIMTEFKQVPTFRRRGALAARRLALVTGVVAGLGAAAVFAPFGATVLAAPAFAKSETEAGKSAVRAWLGVHIQPVTPAIAESMGLKKAEGALVAEPQKDSPASKAGIAAGDVIVAVDGAAIKDAAELSRKIGEMKPGTTVKLDVIRKGETQAMTATLAEMRRDGGTEGRAARANEEPRIGLMVAAQDDGVMVTGIDPDGIAAEHGFRVGDVILEVAGKAVKTPEEVRKALAEARGADRKHVLMRVKSEDGAKFVAVPLARA
jgi:serine protease Do